MSEELSEIFLNSAIKEFGMLLKNSIRPPDDKWAPDYASLVELEYIETRDQFIEFLWKFLRRYEVIARKHNLRRLSEESLNEIIKMVDKYGIKAVRAALIAHALVKSSGGD